MKFDSIFKLMAECGKFGRVARQIQPNSVSANVCKARASCCADDAYFPPP